MKKSSLCVALLASAFLSTPLFAAPPYQDDPEIAKALADLPRGHSLLLPEVNVECGDLTMYGMDKKGPGQRDYCNKMPYAPERETALYAGGNHMVPHRMNDVWEYHLGSNTWHMLYGPDGGNGGKHKAAYFLTSRTLVREPDAKLDEKQLQQIKDYKVWWDENVVFEDGHLATTSGGPIMPAHTWDAFTYDEASRQLVWGMGVSPAGQLSTLAHFTGKPISHWEELADETYTPMWTFDPEKRRWHHYRTDKPHAALRGMGATMAYLPDEKKVLWYVAAQNVSPAAYEMWMFDSKADSWEELKPNGGKSIGELAANEGVAPMSEVQSAYSTKHGILLAVLKNDTFAYHLAENTWSKIDTNPGIYGHDAKSVFAYDSANDVFLLAYPPEGKGKELNLATFSLDTKKWQQVTPKGDGMVPPTQFGMYMGYFDSKFGVFVVQGRYSNRMWVYRP